MKLAKHGLSGLAMMVLVCGTAWGQTTGTPTKVPPARQPAQPTAQPPAGETKPTEFTGPPPRIVFEKMEHSWGNTMDTDPVYMEFKFKNEGEGDLIIVDLHATCGCTVPTVEGVAPEEVAGAKKQEGLGNIKATYKPGEEGVIKVRFNPQGKRNDQHQRVTVRTNDPKNAEMVLHVQGKVTPLVTYDPPIVQFGDVNKGEGMTMFVAVQGRTPEFEVTFATISESDYFDVKVGETTDLEIAGEKIRQTELEVTIKPNAPIGQLAPSLTLRTNDSRKPFDNVPVGVRVIGDLRANPATLAIGAIQPGAAFEKRIRLTSRLDDNFELGGVEQKSNFPGKLEVFAEPVQDGKGYDIVVRGTAPERAIALRGTIHVKTNVKGEEKLEIPFHGNVRPPAQARNQGQPKAPTSPPAPGGAAQGPQPPTGPKKPD